MSHPPLISVVLPTRNRADLLLQSVRSLQSQTYQNWELIIVDDFSGDSTPQIVSQLIQEDSRIRSIRNATNLKLPISLNLGFAMTRGELLTWTSDDNHYLPEAFEAMEGHLAERPDVSLVYTDMNLINEVGEHLGISVRGEPDEIVYHNVVSGAFLYRRCVQTALVQYDPDLFLLEDYEFWLRAARDFKFSHLGAVHYNWRVHDGSLSSSRQTEIRKLRERVMRMHLPMLTVGSNDARARGYLKLAELAWARKDLPQSLCDTISSAYLSPMQTLKRLVWLLRR